MKDMTDKKKRAENMIDEKMHAFAREAFDAKEKQAIARMLAGVTDVALHLTAQVHGRDDVSDVIRDKAMNEEATHLQSVLINMIADELIVKEDVLKQQED